MAFPIRRAIGALAIAALLTATLFGVGCGGGGDDGSERAVQWGVDREVGPKRVRLSAVIRSCAESSPPLERPVVEYSGNHVFIELRTAPERLSEGQNGCFLSLDVAYKTITLDRDLDELVLFDASTDPPEKRWPRKRTRPQERPLQSSPARDLWNRNFIATSVSSRPGKLDPPIQQPPQIRLDFSSKRHHSVGWKARCNGFGGKVHFDEAKLKVEQILGTAVVCGEEREGEDEWLA